MQGQVGGVNAQQLSVHGKSRQQNKRQTEIKKGEQLINGNFIMLITY